MNLQRRQETYSGECFRFVTIAQGVVSGRQVIGSYEHHHQLAQVALKPHLQLRTRWRALAGALRTVLLLHMKRA